MCSHAIVTAVQARGLVLKSTEYQVSSHGTGGKGEKAQTSTTYYGTHFDIFIWATMTSNPFKNHE